MVFIGKKTTCITNFGTFVIAVEQCCIYRSVIIAQEKLRLHYNLRLLAVFIVLILFHNHAFNSEPESVLTI